MTPATVDRTYWHVPNARSWHAQDGEMGPLSCRGFCGRTDNHNMRRTETADRVPANGHLCGSCSRVIAARTDIENHSVTAAAGIS